MALDFSNLSRDHLATIQHDQLVGMVLALHEANEKLKNSADEVVSRKYDRKLEQLEREINKTKQDIRRDTIEISGINNEVVDDDIENKTLEILKAANVKVGNKYPTAKDIQAAHRKGRKGIVIVKFVNRKFAYASLSNSHKLKDSGDYNRIYLNESLCPEFGFLGFAVRQAKKNEEIVSYKSRNGILLVQLVQHGPLLEISHENDLLRNGISIPERTY